MTARHPRTLRSLAPTALLSALSGAGAWAQQNTSADAQPSPPPNVSDSVGSWWAKLYDPGLLPRMASAASEVLTVIIITAIVYVVAMVLLRRAAVRVERDAESALPPERRRRQRVATMVELIRSVAKWVILITGGIWVLAAARMDIRPLLAGAGILGLAVGFGAQNLVRDVVSGFFLLLEGQYAMGDYVQIGPAFGMVESIGLRVTVLKNLDNQRHYLPNGSITSVTVYEEPFVNYVVETPFATLEDANRARDAIGSLVVALHREYARYLVYHGQPTAVSADDTAVVRLPVAIFPTQEWLVKEEIPASIKDALAVAEVPLREGRDVRVYSDLSRMPEYRYGGEIGEAELE